MSESVLIKSDATLFLCDDTVLAYLLIARVYRLKFNIPIISITGSAGKTTTKELTALFLSIKYNTLKTEENLNNEIGVPKMIFRLTKSHQIAVIEAGMNQKNEIKRESISIVSDFVLINNIEPQHLAYLGSLENIAYAKSELFSNVNKNATALINKDTNFVHILESEAKRNGVENILYFSKSDISICPDTSFIYKDILFRSPLIGEFNVYNILAAIKVAEFYSVPLDECAKILTTFKSLSNRMEVIYKNDAKIISDCYNSNYKGLIGMLDSLSADGAGTKIAVIGDILELEMEGTHYHKNVAEYINKLGNIDIVFTCGKHSKDIYENIEVKEKRHFEKSDEIFNTLKSHIKSDTTLLIKASLGVNFISLINEIKSSM